MTDDSGRLYRPFYSYRRLYGVTFVGTLGASLGAAGVAASGDWGGAVLGCLLTLMFALYAPGIRAAYRNGWMAGCVEIEHLHHNAQPGEVPLMVVRLANTGDPVPEPWHPVIDPGFINADGFHATHLNPHTEAFDDRP